MTAWLVSEIYRFGAILSDVDALSFRLYEVLRIVLLENGECYQNPLNNNPRNQSSDRLSSGS